MFDYIYWVMFENNQDISKTPLRLFEYVTFRAGGAAFSAFIMAIVFGQLTVKLLISLQFVAPNRLEGLVEDDEETLNQKKNVPSMGGILILGATILSVLIWADLSNSLTLIFLGLLILLGMIGFADDYLKVVRKSKDGISGKAKLAGQIIIAAVAVYLLYHTGDEDSRKIFQNLWIPFVKTPILMALPLVVIVGFGTLVVVGSSNAVNLSDGMDGLAVGCTVITAIAYAIFAYACGNSEHASYLGVPFVHSAEVSVVAAAIAGAGLGFLWHNCYPASMFMGDTGSLALGGAIGLIAVLVKQEFLLVIIGGIFVVEAGTVILQVIYFKLTRKLTGEPKRLFKCAPIHHHFKMSGWTETQIVIRFWIIALVLAFIGIASLKVR
ncbi:MAG: phospho-N-acetylmuramoyl-pentapeptide-transferase [Lentisphaeria bacterium]|nr:phospho-N-acetylmuramoyl-pentapeptide-transferase [Lentisphaeria bacterium]